MQGARCVSEVAILGENCGFLAVPGEEDAREKDSVTVVPSGIGWYHGCGRRGSGILWWISTLGEYGLQRRSSDWHDAAVREYRGFFGGPIGGLAGILVGAGIGAVWAYEADARKAKRGDL